MPPAVAPPLGSATGSGCATVRSVTIEAAARLLPGACLMGAGSSPAAGTVRFTSVAYDSRQVVPGGLFVALEGARADGNDYIRDAERRGAVAVLTEEPRGLCRPMAETHLPRIVVRDARLALARLSALWYPDACRGIRLVGVTGTNGKTTTCFLIQALMRAAGHRTGMVGTILRDLGDRCLGAEMTTPQSLDLYADLAHMRRAGCTHAALEVSSHALVQSRTEGLPFAAAVFTNLTQDHLDYHGTMARYAEAKAKLFQALAPDAVAVLNADDPAVERMLAGCKARFVYYGLSAPGGGATAGQGHGSKVWADRFQFTVAGTSLRLITPQGACEARLNLLGRHNVANALAAVAVALELDVPLETCVEALARFPGVPGRLERVRCPPPKPLPPPRGGSALEGGHGSPSADCEAADASLTSRELAVAPPPIVLVDYAHTDDALTRVLTTLREVAGSPPLGSPTGGGATACGRARIITVFGCGGDRDATKRPKMGRAVERHSDVAIVTSDNPRTEDPERIIAQILTGMRGRGSATAGDYRSGRGGRATSQPIVVPDRAEAIRLAISLARPGDIVLIAGKGHEDYQIVGRQRVPFDDRRVAAEALTKASSRGGRATTGYSSWGSSVEGEGEGVPSPVSSALRGAPPESEAIPTGSKSQRKRSC